MQQLKILQEKKNFIILSASKAKDAVVVIKYEGKLQSMMPSDPKSYNKMIEKVINKQILKEVFNEKV